jgi:hypothetical protein
MRSFLASCLAALVLAIGAAVVLNYVQTPADAEFQTTGVRLPPA